jgi:TRAP-type C4-dicarboxylate transport system substrate-binding protein
MIWALFLLFEITIKMGSLSPEGSSYMIISGKMKDEFEKITGGKVKIVWYGGGVMGDEPEMVRKIKMGQLNGGGFTGYGLGIIEKSIRILELPGLFEDYDEFYYVWEKMQDDFKMRFRERGFELLAYFPIGKVYVFSNKPISKLDDFSGVKLWVWSGDPLAAETSQVLKGYAQLINLSIADVLTGLQTGMVNAFYNLPYGALALQWSKHVKYMLDFPVNIASGGVVISTKTLDKLSPEHKKALYDLSEKYFKTLSRSLIEENNKAVEEFKKQGIKFISPDKNSPEFKKILETFSRVHEKFKGEFYTPDLYQTVVKLRDEHRAAEKQKLNEKRK